MLQYSTSVWRDEGCSWTQYPRTAEHVVSSYAWSAVSDFIPWCLWSCSGFFSPRSAIVLVRYKHVHWAGQHSEVAFSSCVLSVLVSLVRVCTDTFPLTGC